MQALRTAQQYNGLLMYCQAVGEFKTVCNTLAQWRDIQVPAVRSQLEAAATEQERQAAQVCWAWWMAGHRMPTEGAESPGGFRDDCHRAACHCNRLLAACAPPAPR